MVNKWEKLGKVKRAGILVPLFSVYSKNSLGMGDLEDLKLIIDLAEKTGNSIVHLLPMNEMGPLFCPYDSLSSFAQEPMYISLKAFSSVKKRALPPYRAHLDYGIKKEKMHLLWELYLEEEKQNYSEFIKFKEENTYWLFDFSIFKALKAYHQGKAWYEWEDSYKDRNPNAMETFSKQYKREIEFQNWMQWITFKQFKDAKTYAESKKIFLKGDLPILVSRDSADVWAHPGFFKLEFASGAPPDMYCAKGQRWGMPPHNWERISADGYRYLKEKVRYAEKFYDILRIDHVVGLFRIWSIPYAEPLENQGLNGFFDPPDERKWQEHGREILEVILNTTKMLICAEDLGIIPPVCTQTLKELGIPGNDVQRWVEEYRLLSVSMLSTHDTTNWPAWWENEAGTVDAELFRIRCAESGIDYNYVKDKLFDLEFSRYGRLRWLERIDSAEALVNILGKQKQEAIDFINIYENTYQEKEKLWKHLNLAGPMREKCDKSIIAAALKITLESRSIFCIQLLIDWLYLSDIFKGDPYQYRINTPGTISKSNWSLVIPLSLEELLKHKVCREIRKMIKTSGRI